MYVPCTRGAPPNIAVVVLMSLPLARIRKRGRAGKPVRCAVVRIAAPSKRLLGGLRSDLGIESPNLQSSCRSWMDDA